MKKFHLLALILGSAALVLLLNTVVLPDKDKLLAFVSSSVVPSEIGLSDNVISVAVQPDQWTKLVDVEVKSEPAYFPAKVSELKLAAKASKDGSYSVGFSFEKNTQLLNHNTVTF